MVDKDIAEPLQDTNLESDLASEVEAEEPQSNESEKMLPASRVNEIVRKEKHRVERKMQEQLDAAQQQIAQLQASQQAAPAAAPQGQQMGGMGGQQQGMSPEQIQAQVMQAIQAEMQKKQQEEQKAQLAREVEQVANQYYAKMAQGKDAFDDFEAVTADFDPAAFPELVYLANESDDTAGIIYELRKNPNKLATLDALVQRSPQMARAEMVKLANSIKANKEAVATAKQPSDPLSRLKPSQAGADNGAPKSVRDFRNASWLKA